LGRPFLSPERAATYQPRVLPWAGMLPPFQGLKKASPKSDIIRSSEKI